MVNSPVLAVLGRGLVVASEPVVRADDAGLTRGDGCFEGARLLDGVVDKLDAHLARMARSATALEIPFDAPAWHALVGEAVAAWVAQAGDREAAVKLLLTRGPHGGPPTGFVAVGPIPADYPRLRRDGMIVITLPRGYAADTFRDAPWLLGGIKTLSYAINMAAAREAARRGADDALFVSADGVVLEGPTSTAIWAVGRTLHTTPPGDTGILGGTTQHRLFERAAGAGWQVRETLASVDDLHAADVIWMMGSVRGPVEVIDLDGTKRERHPDVDAEIRRLAGF